MSDEKILQDYLDYLNSPCDLAHVWIQNEIDKAEAAKTGRVLCLGEECPNYLKRDNDGYGWRDCGCSLCEENGYLIQNKICPFKRVKPFRYDPNNEYPYFKKRGVNISLKDGTDVTEAYPIGKRIKEAVDEVYKDWEG